MKLDRIHQISEIIASVAIAASLVFVGIQLRQNTNAVQVSNSQAAMNSWNDLSLAIVNNDGLLQDHLNSQPPESQDGSSDASTLRHQFFLRSVLRTVEVLYIQWQEGNLSDELWSGYRRSMIGSFMFNTEYSVVWSDFRGGVSPGFRTYVDGLQAEAVKMWAERTAAAEEVE